MSMNIKNAETFNLAHQLADLTGESVTKTVTVALRERLDRLQLAENKGMAGKLMAIGKDCESRLKRVEDHGDLLYGENGLPK